MLASSRDRTGVVMMDTYDLVSGARPSFSTCFQCLQTFPLAQQLMGINWGMVSLGEDSATAGVWAPRIL